MKLSNSQRKALRRLGRGQTISRTMMRDTLIKQCYTLNAPTPPPASEMNIVTYTDWEATVQTAKPVINACGRQILNQLENTNSQTANPQHDRTPAGGIHA